MLRMFTPSRVTLQASRTSCSRTSRPKALSTMVRAAAPASVASIWSTVGVRTRRWGPMLLMGSDHVVDRALGANDQGHRRDVAAVDMGGVGGRGIGRDGDVDHGAAADEEVGERRAAD